MNDTRHPVPFAPRVSESRGRPTTVPPAPRHGDSVQPGAVVLADTADDVVEAVRACHRRRIPFVTRGGGTLTSGAPWPQDDGIVMIALDRRDRVLSIDPDARTAVVEPGAGAHEVHAAAAAHGLTYAHDASDEAGGTIGADDVLGVKAVLPDGTLVSLGSASHEQAGPDWAGLLCRSGGLLGVALEVTLRLVPLAGTPCG